MYNIKPNVIVGVVGFLIMLVGLLFIGAMDNISIPSISIGTSILATSLTNYILNRKLELIPLQSIVEALAQNTQFMRKGQRLSLIFSIDGEYIKVEKKHSYNLANPARFPRTHTVRLFSDAPSVDKTDSEGFVAVIGPDGVTLQGDELERHLTFEDGKHVFKKKFKLYSGVNNRFEYSIFDYYRMTDRIIWTVQDLCDGFEIDVKNNTGKKPNFVFMINHHRGREIIRNKKEFSATNEVHLDFDCEVLPYQGFEIMWDFTKEPIEQKVKARLST